MWVKVEIRDVVYPSATFSQAGALTAGGTNIVGSWSGIALGSKGLVDLRLQSNMSVCFVYALE